MFRFLQIIRLVKLRSHGARDDFLTQKLRQVFVASLFFCLALAQNKTNFEPLGARWLL